MAHNGDHNQLLTEKALELIQWLGWAGYAVGGVAWGLLIWLIKRYFFDRSLLLELKRKMAEVDEIRRQTDDCRLPLVRIDRMDSRVDLMSNSITNLTDKQDHLEDYQQEMKETLAVIQNDVKWLCKQRRKELGEADV